MTCSCGVVVAKMLIVMMTVASLTTVNIIGVEGKVTCYVCSYSGQDLINGTVITDTCTPTHFQAASTKKVECDGGCETLAYRNSKNDKIRHFHRNCVDANSGRVLNDRCVDTKSKTMYEEKCECLTSLCNASPPSSTRHYASVLPPMSLTIIVMMVFSQTCLSSANSNCPINHHAVQFTIVK